MKRRTDCGCAPMDFGAVEVPITEMMFYLYLPIKFPDHYRIFDSVVPTRLRPLMPLLAMIEPADIKDRYVYLTAKRTFVQPGSMSNRPGWHCDGFGTDDVNYIWSDCVPTEYAIGKFNLSDDDALSMDEMAQQATNASMLKMPNKHLVRMDDRVVHRVNENHDYVGLRTFVKVSCSRFKYNLEGNSHNHLLSYNWKLHSREAERNMENNGDFVREEA